MPISKITTSSVTDNSITAGKIVAGAVDADIAAGSIDTAQIADDAVTADKIANSINTSIAAALPKAGGAMTGTITGFTSTGIDDNATSTAITIDASENVGIGVVPESWYSQFKALQLGEGGSIWGRTGGGANPAQVYVAANTYYNTSGSERHITTNAASQYAQTAGTHKFQVAPSGTADAAISFTTAMTMLNNGDTQWGTFSSTGATSGTLQLYASAARKSSFNGTGNSTHLAFYNPNGEVGSIRTNGSATNFNTSSDYRLKTDAQPMTNAITTFKQLKPVNFEWIADGTRVDGFLAHELQEVIPEAVTGTKDAMMDEEYEVTPAIEATFDDEGVELTGAVEAVMGTRSVPDMQGIDQSKIVPLLTAALQEALSEIESLKTRVQTLEDA